MGHAVLIPLLLNNFVLSSVSIICSILCKYYTIYSESLDFFFLIPWHNVRFFFLISVLSSDELTWDTVFGEQLLLLFGS